MTKHTPAPWVVRNSQNSKNIIEVEAGTTKNSINHGVPICDVRVVNLPERKKYAQANAHLIAAAPDLLEIAEFIESYNIPSEEMWHVLKKLSKKAVAKARGQND